MRTNAFTWLTCLGMMLSALSWPIAHAQNPSTALSPTSTDEVTKLRAENQKLREENRRLRQLIVDGRIPAPPAQPSQQNLKISPNLESSTDTQGLTHWITNSSEKRHNSRCRWYKTTKGRPGRADEGIACLKCGG